MDMNVIDPLATSLFGLACFLIGVAAGGLAVYAWARLQARSAPTAPPVHIDPWLAAALDQRAQQWSVARGTPGAAGPVSAYLHAAAEAAARTTSAGKGIPRRGRRWSPWR